MCKIYNQTGCLTAIKLHLRRHRINENLSPNELIDFQNSYYSARQQIISNHKLLIEQEKGALSTKIVELDYSIKTKKSVIEQQLLLKLQLLQNQLDNLPSSNSDIIQNIANFIKEITLKLNIWLNKILFNYKIAYSVKYLTSDYNKSNDRYTYITFHTEDAIRKSSLQQTQALDMKKNIIDQINSSIYGALGEEKVVMELEKLPDDYILINDFTCRFDRAIYNRKENDYIKSIQIDHVLLSPCGVFLIETKNWSQDSINNPNLYSPVQQIKRANLALYKILNRDFSNVKLLLTKHHWGSRKVPIKNLIVFIKHKPIEQFEYVKILTLNELVGYIKYFNRCFSTDEVQSMADYLLRI